MLNKILMKATIPLLTCSALGLLNLSYTTALAAPGNKAADTQLLQQISVNTSLLQQNFSGFSRAYANARGQDQQDNQDLENAYKNNNALYTADNSANTVASSTTQQQVSTDLSEIPGIANNQDPIKDRLTRLNAIPASDDLEPYNQSALSLIQSALGKAPAAKQDDTFNFDSIIANDSYPLDTTKTVGSQADCDALRGIFTKNSGSTPIGQCQYASKAVTATNFIDYLNRSYVPLVSGLDLSNLHGDADKIKKLQSDPQYIDYKNKVRSLIAVRSVAVSNLNHMIAERTPQPALGAALGVKDNNGNPVPISPLQAEKYLVDSKLNNPDWYKQVATANSTSLQRQTLIALLQIQRQLAEQHEDNERLIASMTSVSTTLSQASQMLANLDVANLASTVSDTTKDIKQTLNDNKEDLKKFKEEQEKDQKNKDSRGDNSKENSDSSDSDSNDSTFEKYANKYGSSDDSNNNDKND